MSLQDDDEEHEQHPVDDGVDEDGQAAGPEVHEVDRPLPAGQLEDPSRAQQGEQRRRYDRRRPVVHRATELRERESERNRGAEEEGRTVRKYDIVPGDKEDERKGRASDAERKYSTIVARDSVG